MNDSANKKAELYFHANQILIRERNELEHENIGLKAENAMLVALVREQMDVIDKLRDGDALEAENARLREALERICALGLSREAAGIARAVLEAKP